MRRKKREIRQIQPDLKYNNMLVSKLINTLMWSGQKNVARRIVYDCFDIVGGKTKKDPIQVFEEAMRNTSPFLEVKSRRIGGATYQVPMEVRGERRMTLAMRWVIGAARSKKGKPMREKLAEELVLASRNEGDAVKKKENTHRMAEANKAFAHFAR